MHVTHTFYGTACFDSSFFHGSLISVAWRNNPCEPDFMEQEVTFHLYYSILIYIFGLYGTKDV